MPGCLKQQIFKFEKIIIMERIKIYVIIILISCVLFFSLADCQFNPIAKIPKKTVGSSVVDRNGDKANAVSGKTNKATKENDGSASGEAIVSLMINSNPTNASVFIENKSIGNTPYHIPSISCIAHTFKFTKDGYKDKSFVYVLSENPKPLNVSLELAQSDETDSEKQAIADVLNKSKESASIEPFSAKSNQIPTSEGKILAESSSKAANATKSLDSETSRPQTLTTWISILIAALSLIFGPGIIIKMYKYIKNKMREQKKKSNDGKAQLSAMLGEQKEGYVVITVTNVGVAVARNYCIVFSGKTSTGEHYSKKMPDRFGYSIPAQHYIPIKVECNNWIEICVEMRWDDDSGSNRTFNMCFPLTPI
jgi:hypothetical protein